MIKKIPTIFHITHYKAGSQWVYGVLAHVLGSRKVVTPKIAAAHVTNDPIIAHRFYPCVYLPREEFEKSHPPKDHRRFVVIRDLRDTLISHYFSLKFSHAMLDSWMKKRRNILKDKSIKDGLLHMMNAIGFIASANIQQSWHSDTEVIVRYEDLIDDEYSAFAQIFRHCELNVTKKRLYNAIKENSFERLAGRKRGEEELSSHHRKGIAGDWKNYFDEDLKEVFKQHFGKVLIETGYETNNQW